jgi:hypothetical protein
MALGLNDFVGGHWKGWALKSQFFQAQMALVLLVAISGPKKVLISGPTPSNRPCNTKEIIPSCAIYITGTLIVIIPLAGLEIHPSPSLSLCHLFNQAPLLFPTSLLPNCLPRIYKFSNKERVKLIRIMLSTQRRKSPVQV